MGYKKAKQQGHEAKSFLNGVCCEPVLEGACERIQMSRCTLKAGAVWEPERYAYQDKIQIFLFLNPTGYVRTDKQAFPLSDAAVFVPNFDREPFFIHAGAEQLECVRVVGDFNEQDRLEIGKSHMIFPRFRLLKDAWEHTTRETIQPYANTRGFVLIENRKLGSYNMGWYHSDKPSCALLGFNRLPAYDQWCVALADADYTCCVDENSAKMQAGDILFIPRGASFSSRCGQDGKISYVWLMLNRAYDEK